MNPARRDQIRNVAWIATVFAVTFGVTWVVRSQQPAVSPEMPTPPCRSRCVERWLNLDDAQKRQLRQLDPAFEQDLDRLQAELDDARSSLAAAFEDTTTTDESLRHCVEHTITLHNALERRVIEHLILVRSHLTPEQQKRLFSVAAEGVRKGCRRQRHQGGGGSPGAGCGRRDGQPGNGNGHGPRYRGGRGL